MIIKEKVVVKFEQKGGTFFLVIFLTFSFKIETNLIVIKSYNYINGIFNYYPVLEGGKRD